MATKRKADDNIAEDSLATRGRHRQRLEEWNNQINDDIMLQIFKFLPFEDLNSIAVLICRRYRDLRNHESLDQTRTSTIVCSETTTSASVRNAFNQRELNQAFSGNRTHLKIVGVENMPPSPPFAAHFRHFSVPYTLTHQCIQN
jgi:hypothetical protein